VLTMPIPLISSTSNIVASIWAGIIVLEEVSRITIAILNF
jgi:hypothetical protein